MRSLSVVLLCLFFVSCSKNELPPAPKPAPIQASKPLKFEWGHEYNDWFLVKAIKNHGQALLTKRPKDWKEYIDVWPSSEKELMRFWGNILVKMAYFESKWHGSKSYKENFKDRNGKYIYSRGLFQLSLESGLGYKCPFRNSSDVHVDSKNIECAVRILNRWVDRDGVIAGKNPWRGGARYWAVLRDHREYTRKAMKAIKQANRD